MMKQTPTTLALLCVMGFVLVAVAPANGNGGESGSGSGDGDADVDTLSTTAFSSTTRGYNSCAAPAADFDMCYPTVSSPCVMGICFGSMCMQARPLSNGEREREREIKVKMNVRM